SRWNVVFELFPCCGIAKPQRTHRVLRAALLGCDTVSDEPARDEEAAATRDPRAHRAATLRGARLRADNHPADMRSSRGRARDVLSVFPDEGPRALCLPNAVSG